MSKVIAAFAAALAALVIATQPAVRVGSRVVLEAPEDAPAVLVWDSHANLVRWLQGQPVDAYPHTRVAFAGSRAIVTMVLGDEVRVLVTSGDQRKRVGWVRATDVRPDRSS